MGTLTAQMLVGQGHPYHGGINPSHYLFLSENGMASWTLVEENYTGFKKQAKKKIVWIPTIENMLEDAILMIGLYIIKDEKLLKLAEKSLPLNERHIYLFNECTAKQLEEMYHRLYQVDIPYKVTLSVFDDSTIKKQLKVLEKYKMDVEVCSSVYVRERSVWDGKVYERGVLEKAN